MFLHCQLLQYICVCQTTTGKRSQVRHTNQTNTLMNAQSTRVIVTTPNELNEVIQRANGPLVERLKAIEKRLAQEKICYSTAEIGKIIGVSARAVREWIVDGKVDRRGTRHYLAHHELVTGRYVVELPAMQEFIRHF